MLLVSVAAAAADEKRTWTFSQDGEMQSPSGGRWSFSKNGRLDAALIGLEGTNVTLLAIDGQYRVLPVTSLSENDRAYLLRANGISERQAADMEQTAALKSADSSRKSEIARLKTEAASKRRTAQLEIEAADRLENEAGRLSSRASNLEYSADHHARVADRIENSAVVTPRAAIALTTAKAAAGLKTGAADRLEGDMTNLRRDAADKRANANRLSAEAADLENMARTMEFGAAPRRPVAR